MGLNRQSMLVFASAATSKLPSVFGSLVNGTPTTATNVGIGTNGVQSLAGSIQGGWATAVVGTNSFAIEDLNALMWLFSYQLAYILERGVPEWDTNTTYSTGDIVRDNVGSGLAYVSLANSNIGNPTTDGVHWFNVPQPGLCTNNAANWTTTTTIPNNQTVMWPNMGIAQGTYIVPSTTMLLGFNKIVASGTGVLQATGTGVIKIYP